MKKAFIFSLVLIFVFSLSFSVALAKSEKAEMGKVEICHVTDYTTLADDNPLSEVVGHRITISMNALAAHQEHGDFIYTEENDIDYGPVLFGLTWRQIAENNGLNLAGVDCSGFVLDF